MNSVPVLIEISDDLLRVQDGERRHSIKLERQSSGRLTDPSRQRLVGGLRGFLQPKPWQARRRALCALGARGVSVRTLSLPVVAPEQLQRLLRLQIESAFPLPPEQMAWGVFQQSALRASVGDLSHGGETLVAAVRREGIDEYRSLLEGVGLAAEFTLAAWARAELCRPSSGRWAMLYFSEATAELALFEGRALRSVEVLAGPKTTLAEVIERMSKRDPAQLGDRLWMVGVLTQDAVEMHKIAGSWGENFGVEPLVVRENESCSAALAGLEQWAGGDHRGALPLTLNVELGAAERSVARGPIVKWAGIAAVLALSVLLLRYAETRIERTRLTRAIAQVRTHRESLPVIDQQLAFFQHLQTNRHPYLRLVAAVAKSASPGMKIESISLNRRGDLLLRGTVQGRQPPTEFRTKLVDTGVFTSVVLEEQTPTPDNKKITFRIAARWDAERARDLPELAPVEKRKPGPGSGPTIGPGMGGSYEPIPRLVEELAPGLAIPPGEALPDGVVPPPLGVSESGFLPTGGPAGEAVVLELNAPSGGRMAVEIATNLPVPPAPQR